MIDKPLPTEQTVVTHYTLEKRFRRDWLTIEDSYLESVIYDLLKKSLARFPKDTYRVLKTTKSEEIYRG